MKQNKFINEEDMLTSIFAGQTDSVRPIGDNLNVWRYLPRSATLHFSRKTTPYTSYDYYVSFEYSNEIELPSID